MTKLVYYKNLDGIRGLAALMVLIFHFFSYPISTYFEAELFRKLTVVGEHGVSLFFVLSGFVVTRILLKKKNDKASLYSFYKNRILRIFPLYYFSLLVWYFVLPLALEEPIPSFESQIPFYLYLQNFSWLTEWEQSGPAHFWSLAVEEHFYLLWPILIILLGAKKLNYKIYVIVFLVLITKYFFLINGLSINKLTFTRLDQIALGGVIAFYEVKNANVFSDVKTIRILSILSVFSLLLGGYILFVQEEFFFYKELFKYNILALFFLCIIWIAAAKSSQKVWWNSLLMSRPFQLLGKVSYGIYVWHIFILVLQQKFFISEIVYLDLSITIILTLSVSYISFLFIEKPFLKLKTK